MNETEFNLIDEPWVRVMENDCTVKEVSLKDAIINAHNYKCLSGELPTQDIAVMRLILAVLHTVFSRVDEEGNEDTEDKDDEKWATKCWKSLWERGSFSEKAIEDYFEKWHERFWLFHPERPFGQVAGLKKGSKYMAAKLNGEISESNNNNARLFSLCFGKNKTELTYSQAIRWLLYLNAYDDNNVAKHRSDNASKEKTGIGWLGKLGLIHLVGENLFETLMLNLVMINGDDENKVQCEQKPTWEYDIISSKENNKIKIPENLAELYSLQSRRIILVRNDEEKVIGYEIYGGDFFEKENAFFEPMTVWKHPKDKKGNTLKDKYVIKNHDSTKQIWREFATLYSFEKTAGVIEWYNNYLQDDLIEDNTFVKTAIASVIYGGGGNQSFVENIFSDSLQMHSSILSEVGANFRTDIKYEIEKCEEVAKIIGKFASNVYIASGGSNKNTKNIRNDAMAQLYYRLDVPFRNWLMKIAPDNIEYGYERQWEKTAKKIALDYAKEISDNVSEAALIGHYINDKDNKKSKLYSVPNALIIFKSELNKIYGKESNK